MDFSLANVGDRCGEDCPQAIVADGQIDRDTPDAFLAFLKSHSQSPRLRNVVLLHSPGGNLVAAMRLGSIFRKIGSVVIVARPLEAGGALSQFAPAGCMSACVYALAGGKTRVVPPASQLGIHRAQTLENTGRGHGGEDSGVLGAPTPPQLIETLRRYIREMGVSVSLVDAAQGVPHSQSRILTGREIRAWRLARETL